MYVLYPIDALFLHTDSSQFRLITLDYITKWTRSPSLSVLVSTAMSLTNIRKIYLGNWGPLGVNESSLTRIPGLSNHRVDWTKVVDFWCTWVCCLQTLGVHLTNVVAFSCIWDCWGYIYVDIRGLLTTMGAPGSKVHYHGSTRNRCRAVWEKGHLLSKCCWCAWKS